MPQSGPMLHAKPTTSRARGALVLAVDGRPLLVLVSRRHDRALAELAKAAARREMDASGRARAVFAAFAREHGHDLAQYEVALARRDEMPSWMMELETGDVTRLT